MKLFTISILLVITTGVLILYKLNKAFSNFRPDVKIVPIQVADTKLYLKAQYSGITADKKIILLSTDSLKDFKKSSRNYTYFETDFLFYEVKKNTLYLFVYNKCKPPATFDNKIKIQQIQLDNREMMRLYHLKSNSLKKFE